MKLTKYHLFETNRNYKFFNMETRTMWMVYEGPKCIYFTWISMFREWRRRTTEIVPLWQRRLNLWARRDMEWDKWQLQFQKWHWWGNHIRRYEESQNQGFWVLELGLAIIKKVNDKYKKKDYHLGGEHGCKTRSYMLARQINCYVG